MIFLGPALSAFFCEKYNFSERAQISHACFWWWFKYVLQVWWNLVNFEKMLKFHDISKGRHCQHFLWNKSTSLKRLKFHMHVSDDDSNKYILQVWWNLMNFEKMLKFHDISRACTVSIFLWRNITSLNGLKFHMHVSDDDSNKFCILMKFCEHWINVEIFMIFLGPALSAFFCEKYNFSERAQISHACFWWWFQ